MLLRFLSFILTSLVIKHSKTYSDGPSPNASWLEQNKYVLRKAMARNTSLLFMSNELGTWTNILQHSKTLPEMFWRTLKESYDVVVCPQVNKMVWWIFCYDDLPNKLFIRNFQNLVHLMRKVKWTTYYRANPKNVYKHQERTAADAVYPDYHVQENGGK